MFNGCESLKNNVDLLENVNLSPYCYSHMFEKCTSLEKINKLSSMILRDGCYEYMYSGCNSLTNLSNQQLLASELVYKCYEGMFKDCSYLQIAPTIYAKTLADSCMNSMF